MCKESLPKNVKYRNCMSEGGGYNDGLIGSSTCAFDLYQNHRPFDDFERPIRTLFTKGASCGARCKSFQHESRPMTLVSKNIRYTRIFAEVSSRGASNYGGVVDDGNLWRFRWLGPTSPETLEIMPTFLYGDMCPLTTCS